MKRRLIIICLILLTGIGLFAQTITIGTGTTTSNIWGPYHGATEDARFQYLISASELTSAGLPANDILTSLAFDVTTHNSSQAFTGLTIKIAHTTSTGFSFGAPFLSETFTTVYSGNYSTTGTGWNTHAFSTPFQWNGTNNIVIEICFDNSSTTASDYIHMTTSGIVPSSPTNKATGTGSGCSLSATGTGGWRPNMRFTHSNHSPCSTPADQPTSLSLTNVTHNSIDGSFSAAASSPDNYLVVVSTSSTLSSNPVDGVSYNGGDPLGGGTVVQASSSTSFNSTNLNSETTYYYFIFSYNSACSGGPLYNTTSPLTGNETTTTAPPTCDYSIKLVDTYGDTWNGGKITVYVESIAVITDATVTSGDNDGDWKIINFTVDDGGEITTDYTAGSYSSENEYYIYDVADAGGTEVYSSGTGGSTPGDLGSSVLSASCPLPCTTPSDQPTVLNLSPDYYQIDGSYTAAVSSPDEYLVVISTSSSLSSNPIDGTTYSASDPLGGGTVVQAGSSTSFSSTGLSMGTTYYFFIFSYNSVCTGGPLYNTTSPLTNNETTLSCTVSSFPYLEDFDVLTPNNGTVNCVSTVDLSSVCWTNEAGDDTDWVARSSSTASSNTGPSSDHTSGGNYLFIESSSCYSKTAIMTSPTFDVSSMSVPTLSFYYHMYGSTMGTLTVDAYYNGTWNNGIWTLSGDQGNAWYEAEVSIPAAAGFSDLKLRFNGLTGSDYSSDMAIDNVSLIDIPCPDPSDLAATNITGYNADLSWTENGTATSWDIELGAGGFSPTGTPTHLSVWNDYEISGLTPETSYDYYLRADCGGGDYSNWIGPYNFTTIESCPAPSGLSATSITSSSANLSWTENGLATEWDIEYGAQGFTQGTGTTISATTDNPYSLSGLSPNTSYDYYVRSDCGGSDYSTWAGPFEFTTACGAISTFPWVEDFDGETTPDMPSCWLIEDNSAPNDDWMTSTSNSSSSPNCMYISYDGANPLDYWAFSPGFSLSNGVTYRIEFVYRAYSGSYNESLALYYGTSQNSSDMSVELFDNASFNHITYQTVSVEFTPSATATYYFGWHAYSAANLYGIHIDDISVIELTPMTYVSSNTTQNTDYTFPADTDHHILGIEIETTGVISPFDVTQFNINMNGSTDISDVSNIKLYYSGTSSTFSTSNLFGTVSPSTGTLSINGTQTLSEGTNYFWLTYDVALNATINNYVDAECVQITMNGGVGNQVPGTTAPSGNCEILDIQSCEHKIILYDYENDGWGTYWNGSATVDRTVDVLVDGTPVLTDITLASGDNGTYYTFEVEEGATVSTLVYGGSSQMKYIITGGNGDFVLEDGSNMTTPTGTSGTASCDFESLFTLNGDAYFSEASGAKSNSSGDEITLTSDIKTQKSSAWFNYMLDLSEDFEIDFTMNFGTRNAGTGADGIVFSLQGDCLSCGGTGLSIGYGGISPSVGIEFDTYYNPTMTDYAPSGEWDHTAIFKNGSNDHAGTDVLAASVGLAQDAFSNVGITDGADYTATVKWTASSNLLEMYWNGSPTATITYSDDIVTNIFSGNNLVYWGFTSGTGEGTNKHTVKVNSYPTITSAAQLQDEEIDQGDTYQSELNDFAASYTWTPNDGTISNTVIHNPIFSPTVTTTYCCDIEDDCGNIIMDCFTLTVNSTLPVELLSFSANCLNDEVLLNWVTANEINSDYFVVQRSDDLLNWKDLTYVEAAGNSNHNLNYNYNDLLMKESIIYYRLKIVDMDGSFNNSNVITVSCKGESDFNFELYPNPVNQKLTVRFLNNDAESVKLYMTNSIGQIVYQTKFVELEFSTEIKLDVSNLPEGIYMLNIVYNSSGRLVSRKLVKQKF